MAAWELLLSAAGGALGAFGSSYFRRAGELTAIRMNLDTIRSQAAASAEAAKAVEQRFNQAAMLGNAEFEFRRSQLTELYGPLYASLKTTAELYDLWMSHKMPEVNGPFKLLLAEKNRAARQLIVQKAHLIEGGRMPDSFCRFVTSTTIWDLYASPTPDGEIPAVLSKDERVGFPKDFVDHVYAITEKLKTRLDELYQTYAMSPEGQASSPLFRKGVFAPL
jgi:hypothetical protein